MAMSDASIADAAARVSGDLIADAPRSGTI
jgi:hypothetical protein